jgi:hypothetical protein
MRKKFAARVERPVAPFATADTKQAGALGDSEIVFQIAIVRWPALFPPGAGGTLCGACDKVVVEASGAAIALAIWGEKPRIAPLCPSCAWLPDAELVERAGGAA